MQMLRLLHPRQTNPLQKVCSGIVLNSKRADEEASAAAADSALPLHRLVVAAGCCMVRWA
jgi:hypothetical protein